MAFVFILLAALLARNLHAEVEVSRPSKTEVVQKSVVTTGGQVQDKAEIIQKAQTLQVPFIANEGQTDERVRFYANTFGGTVFVTGDGEIVYSLPKHEESAKEGRKCRDGDVRHGCRGADGQEGRLYGWYGQAPFLHTGLARAVYSQSKLPNSEIHNPKPETQNPPSEIQNLKSDVGGVALKEELVGGKIGEIRGGVQSVTTVSYFKGNDPSKWKSSISTYEAVDMGEVYEGIGLKLKAHGNNVEKLFTVKPGASPGQIMIRLEGVKDCGVRNAECGVENPKSKFRNPKLQINESGELVAETELGPVKFTKPVAYQEIDGKRVDVEVAYSIQGTGIGVTEGIGELKTKNSKPETQNPKLTYGFTVASYDTTKDLIIDPLLASTFLGGISNEEGYSVAIDAGGKVYVTGSTQSSGFPTTPGAYNTLPNGNYDVFVSRFDSNLTSLMASTFLGGSSSDWGQSVARGAGGKIYVTGYTYSTNFPTKPGAYDTSYNGNGDVFVSRFKNDLTSLEKSTFLGGSLDDLGISIARYGGKVYVTGHTYSTNFPTTPGAYDTSYNGNGDAFVSRFNSGLTNLDKSTFLGGSGDERGNSIAVYKYKSVVYVTGYTYSTNFPVTTGSYGGNGDAFVSRFNSGLTSLQVSTFLGESDNDRGNSIAITAGGKVYVTGYTASSNFPTTTGSYDTSHNGGMDVFISRTQ